MRGIHTSAVCFYIVNVDGDRKRDKWISLHIEIQRKFERFEVIKSSYQNSATDEVILQLQKPVHLSIIDFHI